CGYQPRLLGLYPGCMLIHLILLTIFTGGIIFLANYFGFITISTPTIPFLGKLRIHIIYPFVVPIIVAIFANTVNMLEGYNGEGSGTCLIAMCFLFVCGIIFNSAQGVIFAVPVIAVLIPFFLYNKFPAKIFPGDVGTLSMGAMISCVMLFGSLEVAAFSALLIHIFNSFYVIRSVKGFMESDDIHGSKSDIILLEDDRIKASDRKDAVLTLPRLILARGPLTEPELTKNFFAISIFCGFFSILMTFLLLFTKGSFSLEEIIIIEFFFFAIFSIPSALLLLYFPRIRGVITIMILLLVFGCFFLILINQFVLPIQIPDINLGFVFVPVNVMISLILAVPGIMIWYFITIKYFWYEMNRMKDKE
ncbi:MAG: hypothetical protein ACFE8P_14075, partial [Promethearchaeota archaeon]